MKKAIVKILSMMIVMAIVLAAVACSSDVKSTKIDTSKITPTEPITISQFGYDRGVIPGSEGSLENNWFTKYVGQVVLDKFNIKVKYVMAPSAQREQKLAIMLAGNEAPDICMTYDRTLVMNYATDGGLTDLEPLLDKYGSDIKKVVGEDRLEQSKIGGKLVCILSAYVPMADTTFVRKDWLDKLGLKAPTNPQEFYEMLKAFKDKDPGNLGANNMPFAFSGINDMPFLRMQNICLQGFLKESPTREKLMTPFQLWPETKEMYRYFNMLYNEKLMGEFIIDKDQSQYKQKIVKGELGATSNFAAWMSTAAYGSLENSMRKNVPSATYISIFPWKDSSAKESISELLMYGYDNGQSYFIPKTSKNTEAAFKYLNFIASDYYVSLAYSGIEGTDFSVVNGVAKPIDPAAFIKHVGWIAGAYNTLAVQYAADPEKYKIVYSNGLVGDTAIANFLKNTVAGSSVSKYSLPVIPLGKPMQEKYSANLATKWASIEAKMIVGSVSDFDKNFAEGLATWKSEGGDEIAKENQGFYEKLYKK